MKPYLVLNWIGSKFIVKVIGKKGLEIQRIRLNNGLEVSYKIIFKKEKRKTCTPHAPFEINNGTTLVYF